MNVRDWLNQEGTQLPDPANPEEWDAYQRAQWDAVSAGLGTSPLDLSLPPSVLGMPTPIAPSAPLTGMTSTTTAPVGLPPAPSADTRPSWLVSQLDELLGPVVESAGRSWYAADEQGAIGRVAAESEPVQSAAAGMRNWIVEETPAGAYYQMQTERTERWLEQPYQAPTLPVSGALWQQDATTGTLTPIDPWRAFQERYDPNSQAAQAEAFGALFGGMGAYAGAWVGDRMEEFRRSEWADPLSDFGNKLGLLDDLVAISPIPGLGLSAVETLWGPVEAFQTVGAQRVADFQAKWNQSPGYEGRTFVPVNQTGEWFADVWGLAAAIPGDIGQTYRGFQAARDPRTYFEPGYLEQREAALDERGRTLGSAWQTVTTKTNPWALPLEDWQKWGNVGSALLGYLDLDFGWGASVTPTREETEFERNWRALAMSAYGVVDPKTGQSLGISESYQMAANWLVERDAMVAQMRSDAAAAHQLAASGVAPAGGQTPDELNYMAAFLEGEAIKLEEMNMADWVDENTSLLQRVGWNLALDWTEAVGKVNTLAGLAGGAPRAALAAKGVLHLDEVRAVQNVVRGLAGEKIGWLGRMFADETGATTVGGALFAFDPLARIFYPQRADSAAASAAQGVMEVKEVDLIAAINAPSMIVNPEDVVMSTLSREESMRQARAARGRLAQGWFGESQMLGALDVDVDELPLSLLPVSDRATGVLPSTAPAEVRDLRLPAGVFDEAAWEGRDREVLGRISGYLKQNWAAFGSAGGLPTFEAMDIYRRIAETPGEWSQAGALMLDLERQIGVVAGDTTQVVLDLPSELVANRAQLWDTLVQLQALAQPGGWMMTTPAREVVDSGQIMLQAGSAATEAQFSQSFSEVLRQRLFYASPEEVEFYKSVQGSVSGDALRYADSAEEAERLRAMATSPYRWNAQRNKLEVVDPHAALQPWMQAADEVVMSAIKGEYADYRAALPRQAQNFEAAAWLFEQFARGSYDTAYALDLGFAKPGELPAFMASVTDIETARAADLLMEASELGYYLDWEQMRVTPKGVQVPMQAGQATELSVMRSAPTYLDELITRAGGTQHPSMTDIALRQYGPELLETLEAGGAGVYMAPQPGQNLRGAYQQMADVAQQAGLQVEVLDVDQGGFNYRLSPSSGAEVGSDAYAKWVAMFDQPLAPGNVDAVAARLQGRPDVQRAYAERDLGWRTFGGGGRQSPDVTPYAPRLLPSGAEPPIGTLVEKTAGDLGQQSAGFAHWMFDLLWPSGAFEGAAGGAMTLPMVPASRNMLDPARSLPFSYQVGVDAPEAIWATAEQAARGNTQMLSALRTRIEAIGYQASLVDVRRVVDETVAEMMPGAAAPLRQRVANEYMGFVGRAFYSEQAAPYDELLGQVRKALVEADATPSNAPWRATAPEGVGAKDIVGDVARRYWAGAPAEIVGDLREQALGFVRDVLLPVYQGGQRAAPVLAGGRRLPTVAPLLDVLDSAAAGADDFVYTVLTPGTWKVDERGQLVMFPQSFKRSTGQGGASWAGGFEFYTSPGAAMRGTPYEQVLGSPEQAYARGVVGGPMGGGSGFTPAAHDEYELPAFDQLDEADQLDAERGLVNDEGTIVEVYRPYDNSPDVGSVEDLYPWVRERPQLPPTVRPAPPYPSLIPPEELSNYSATAYYAESLRAYGAVTERPDRPAAIARATADYPVIAIRRSELASFVASSPVGTGREFTMTDLGATEAGALHGPLAGDTAAPGGLYVRPGSPYASIQLPQGSFVVGTDTPKALPGPMSSPTSGYGVFVAGLYERAVNMVAGLPVGKLRELLDLQAQTFGDAAMKVADTLDDAKLLEMAQQQPGFFVPKGVPVRPGDSGYWQVPAASVRSDALKQDTWKQFAWLTGAWHEPAEASWKSEVPWYLKYYGGQYFPPTQQGYERMLYDLLSPGYGASKEDAIGGVLPAELASVVPDVLRENPALLGDYQLLVGAALGYDIGQWKPGAAAEIVMPPGAVTEGLPEVALLQERALRTGGSYLSARELDPTYWQAVAKARGHAWAADLPEDVVMRLYRDWTEAQAKAWSERPLLASQPNPYAPLLDNVLTGDPEVSFERDMMALSSHYRKLVAENSDMAERYLSVTSSVVRSGKGYEDAQRLLYQLALAHKDSSDYEWMKHLAERFTRDDFDQLQAMVNFQNDTGEWGLLYEVGAPGYREAMLGAWDDTVGDLSDDLMTGAYRSVQGPVAGDYLQRLRVPQGAAVRPVQDADAFLADFERVVAAFGGSANAPTDAIWDALSAGYAADTLMTMQVDEIAAVSDRVIAAAHNAKMGAAWDEMGWLDRGRDIVRQVGDFFADESGELRLGGWFGSDYVGRPSDASKATRVYEMGLTPAELGYGSWAEALARGETELIESEMRRRLMPGSLSEAAQKTRYAETARGWVRRSYESEVFKYSHSEYGYAQTFLTHIDPKTGLVGAWSEEAAAQYLYGGRRYSVGGLMSQGTRQAGPYSIYDELAAVGGAVAAEDVGEAAPFVFGLTIGRDGDWAFKSAADMEAFVTWLDTTAKDIPESFYGWYDPATGGLARYGGVQEGAVVPSSWMEGMRALGWTEADVQQMSPDTVYDLLQAGRRRPPNLAQVTSEAVESQSQQGAADQADDIGVAVVDPASMAPVSVYEAGVLAGAADQADDIGVAVVDPASMAPASVHEAGVLVGAADQADDIGAAVVDPASMASVSVGNSPPVYMEHVYAGDIDELPPPPVDDEVISLPIVPAGGSVPPMPPALAPTGVIGPASAGGGSVPPMPPAFAPTGVIGPASAGGGSVPPMPPALALIQGPMPAPVDHGRFGKYGRPWEDLNPLPSARFAPSRSTRATVDVREMDLLGTAIGSIGANSEELAVILNAIAYDPSLLITGIDGSSLGRLSAQLDADNMLRLGPGVVGNLDMANAMSLMEYAQPELNRWALELQDVGGRAPVSFDAFKERWGGIFQTAATQYYGTGIGDNPVWRAAEQVGHTQRAVVAELSLSASPGVWAANAIGANWANQVEGYGAWRTTEELVQSLDAQVGGVVTNAGPGSGVGVTLPTQRTQGAVEGKVVGSGAYLGLGSESLVFRPDRWGEELIDLTMGWWASPDQVQQAKAWWQPVVQRAQSPQSVSSQPSLFDRLLSLFTLQPVTSQPSSAVGRGVLGPTVVSGYGGVGGALDAHNPLAPLATVSELASHVWTGNVSIAGGHVGIGEQANYLRSFTVASEQARRFNYQQAFGPVWESAEQRFGANDPVIRALRDATASKLQTSSRRDIAEIADIVLNTMVQRSDPAYRDYKNFIARDLLGTYDEYSYAGFKAAQAGADNVMLEPSLRSNFDEWLAPFFAFSYFAIHNAMNWAARSLRDPQTLRNYMLFQRAAEIENENSDVPTRYEGTLPGPWGVRFGNPWDVLSGGAMRRFAPNEIGLTQAVEAETTGDLVSGAVSAANLRFLPLWGALATGDASYAIQSTGWQLSAADLLLRSAGRRGLGIEDQTYDPYRAGRWIGGETLEGTYTPAQGLMGQQYLYQRMWEQGGIAGPMTLDVVDQALAAAGSDLGQLAMSTVSSDALMRLMARVLLPMGVKQPVPEGEVIGARMGEHMRQIGPSPENPYGSWQNIDTWKERHPEWQVWAARGSLYPEQEQVPPTPTPADRLFDVVPGLPGTPSVPPPAGWQPPAFDLGWGRRMNNAEDSPYAESGDTTAIYALVDPRTDLVRYIGQSLHPSQRYVQHLEEFAEKGFDHPKTAWEAELYRAGQYPQMYVFDWQPGTVGDKSDSTDKMEQLWIGFMRYEVGVGVEGWGFGDVNVSVPDRAAWEALLAESGLTVEEMRQMVTEIPRRGDPVQLERAPKIDWEARSPFPGQPLTPEEILLAEANPVAAAPAHWARFATWVDGLTPAHEQALYDAGVHTWDDLAQAAGDEGLRVRLAYQVGVSIDKIAQWAGHADYTVRVQAGEAPVPPVPASGATAGATSTVGAPPQPAYNPLSSGALAAGVPVEPDLVLFSDSTASLVEKLSQAPDQSQFALRSSAELAALATALGVPVAGSAAPVQPVVLDASGRRGAPVRPGYDPLSSAYAAVMDEDAGEAAYAFSAVYPSERLDAAMVALSQSHQLMAKYGDLPEGAPELLGRERFKQSYGAMQGVMRYYSFTDEARRYLTDNVAPYVYDLEAREGGGFFQPLTSPDTVMLYGVQPEAMVHELSHAWWDTQRQQERNGRQQSTAFADEVKFLGKMQRIFEEFGDSYIEDPAIAKLITEYVYGDGEEFAGFYAGDQVNDHEIFAGLASGVMGDTSRLPASLQPYYAGLFAPAAPASAPAGASAVAPVDAQSSLYLPLIANATPTAALAPVPVAATPTPPMMTGSPFLESMSSSMLARIAGIEGWPTGGGAPAATSGSGVNAGNLVWGATSLLGLARGWFQPSAGGLAGLYRLGQAAVAQTGDFFRGAQAYQEQVERAPGGGALATGPGAAVSSKYWYLPGYRPSVKPGVGFALPTVPGGEFWLPANMTRILDENGSPQADWLNNPQFDPAHPEESMRRLTEVYGPLQPVPLEWLGQEPAYFGPGEHNIYDQPRLVARGRQGLQGSPYGVEGAGGMFRTIGAPDPRTQGDLAANWAEEAAKPRGEYGIWLETPFGGEAEVTQGFGENPDDYAQFGVGGHTGIDWSMKEGREITAAAPGQVVKVGFDEGGYGNYIVMSHDFGQTLYGHLSGVGVEVGQWLAVGDLLGLSGNTGRSTGAHLHFELILPDGDAAFGGRVDPTAYLPGGGTASSLGWMLADIPGISQRQVEALVDAGVLTPEQVAGEAPLPGMTQILSPEELAHWLDVNVFDAGGSDAVSARQGWNLIAGAKAMLQSGPKPVKPTKSDGEGVVLGDGSVVGTLLRPGLVPGLTEAMIRTLSTAGITTFEQLSGRDSGMGPNAWMEALTALPGIGPATADKLVTGTLDAISSGKIARATEGGPPPAQPGDRPLEAGTVKGVGPVTLDKLRAAGITTVEQLRDTAPEWLASNVEGIGEGTAGDVVAAAAEVAVTPWDGRPNWEGLPYIGEATEAEMYEKGYTDPDALATVSPKRLAYDLGISEERARNAINAYRKANGLPELTEEAEAALEALEGMTPDDLEDINGVGAKLEERLYKGGYSTHASLYGLGFDDLKRVLAQPDGTTLKVLNALREEQGLPPFTSVVEARGETAAAVGEETGSLGAVGASSGQQQLLERQGVKTLKDLTEVSDADLAKWLGIPLTEAQEMKRRAQQDIDARRAAGDGAAAPESLPDMSEVDPFAARAPADDNMQRAFAVLQKLRRGERPERLAPEEAPATVAQDTSMKPDARLNLGDVLSTFLGGFERGSQPAIKVMSVTGAGEGASGGSGAALATAAKGLGVSLDQLSEELLAKLRLTLMRDVFDEFEKVMGAS